MLQAHLISKQLNDCSMVVRVYVLELQQEVVVEFDERRCVAEDRVQVFDRDLGRHGDIAVQC
mgnify:CR=1 FL=1